jgi:WD40 repeat protein
MAKTGSAMNSSRETPFLGSSTPNSVSASTRTRYFVMTTDHFHSPGSWSATLSWSAMILERRPVKKCATTITGNDNEAPQITNTPVLDMTQEMLIHEYTASGWILSQVYSPDGKTIALGEIGGSIDLLDVETGMIRQTIKGLGGDISCMDFSPDGSLLAIGGGADTSSTIGFAVLKTVYWR